MPFPDELARGLAVVAYDRRWPGDFAVLARRIHGALGPIAVRVNHVGSTSVPGLAAKDCIDVQAEVQALDEQLIAGCFEKIGFRLRPDTARDAWSDFKQRLAAMATDIYQYGQAKAGPTQILMIAAESWASRTQWASP
jgi:GrpB-like predicted nucleotidyltransferase (UPF0157 family)